MSIYAEKIILFDGDCSFCDRTVNFLFDHNTKRTLYFTSQQSVLGKALLEKNNLPTDLNTIYFYANGKVYQKADAFFSIAKELDGICTYFSYVQRIVPKKLADWCYDRIAKRRHLLLGKKDSCRLMTKEEQQYFLL
ncbi:thiol-disulfide oxidoreductase DCC family protein [Dokdonia ponticola]|uniref:Thiol-disulfide oxidoreductase DCC family protein n=1 Tax=Dokdonia ponticola TaxID=2041041 RepID=A0ABV9HRP4_9FLAO